MGSSVNVGQGFEHKRFKPPALNNMHAAANWFEELNTPPAEDFKKRWHAKYPDEPYINDMGYNAYVALYLYKAMVEKAESTKLDDLRRAVADGNLCVDAPEGRICMDPKSQHMSHHIDKDFGVIQPYWLAQIGCDLTKDNPQEQYSPNNLPQK